MDLQTLSESIDRIADRYDRHAALEHEVCDRLIERTGYHRRAPAVILDLGCGTGYGAQRLKRKFRRAQLLGLDASRLMLSQFHDRSSLLRPLRAVCGDMGALPFPDRSVDMVFSNLAVFCSPDTQALFAEIRRTLRPEGMLLFSTLGPASLGELRQSTADLGFPVRLPVFPDLLELGDALAAAGFREPVMDVDHISLSYRSLAGLKAELEATGTALLIGGWERLDAADDDWAAAWAPLRDGASHPLGFEIIYGTAFEPREGQPRKTPQGDVATFSVDSLRGTGRREP